ncbi:uncharacterized protein GGS25DRAFT_525720 [Hypoxylon fragiforme]|uniref:uncharacterized protein n=1 Tax=Hypoxylon fragiforme TaxID=63214 RepID=UPI0020C5D734|nr:uncharacterized protein GGS25DRAFT_525720 [Hypoxylon fragiforme]KAI2604433.1 hypothetical protein GGS25DRAFT_525720 [Hypoxylon fragiforme]
MAAMKFTTLFLYSLTLSLWRLANGTPIPDPDPEPPKPKHTRARRYTYNKTDGVGAGTYTLPDLAAYNATNHHYGHVPIPLVALPHGNVNASDRDLVVIANYTTTNYTISIYEPGPEDGSAGGGAADE